MFGSDKKRQEKLEAAERRVADAVRRERERVEAERAERAERLQGSLHRIGYLDEKLNERDYRKGEKRVERAEKRERKNIRKEKNRKYWWLLLVLIALIAGGVAGYLVNGHLNHKANYEIANDLIVAKDYEAAEMLLDDMKYKDSRKLDTYLQLRTGIESYKGKLDEYLSALEELESFENKDITEQYKEYIEKVRPACEIQAKINALKIEELSLSDKDMIEELRVSVDELSDKYQELLNTKKLKEARIKMATLEEATDQLSNMQTQPTDENGQTEQSEQTDQTQGSDGAGGTQAAGDQSSEDEGEDEFNTDSTDAP